MDWCRLHADFLNNPKILKLSRNARLLFIELMMLATKADAGGDTLCDEKTAAIALRLHHKTFKTALKELQDTSITCLSDRQTIFLKGWKKWQFVSDNSTERSRKSRQKQKEENAMQRCRDVAATAPDTDTDTDTERKGRVCVEEGGTARDPETPETPPHSPPAEPEGFRSIPQWGIPPAPATPPDKHRLPSAPPPGPVNPACPPPRPAASPPLRPDHPADGRPPADLLRWKADPAFALGFAKAYPATGLPAGDAGMAEIYQLYRRIVAQRLATPDRLAAAARAYSGYLTDTSRPAKSAANWLKFAADGWDANWHGMTEDYHTTRQKQAEKPAPWLGDLSEIQLAPGEKEIVF